MIFEQILFSGFLMNFDCDSPLKEYKWTSKTRLFRRLFSDRGFCFMHLRSLSKFRPGMIMRMFGLLSWIVFAPCVMYLFHILGFDFGPRSSFRRLMATTC